MTREEVEKMPCGYAKHNAIRADEQLFEALAAGPEKTQLDEDGTPLLRIRYCPNPECLTLISRPASAEAERRLKEVDAP